MTTDEKRLIADCRIRVIGASDFIDNVNAELIKSGFSSISIVSSLQAQADLASADMVAECVGEGRDCIKEELMIPIIYPFDLIPIIYPFDFVDGAAAIVIMPGDDNELQRKDNMRLWAAEYMAGYCAFWNVEGCDWLQTALQSISAGKNSDAALRTATHICARIAANIAVGRKVRHFPRFYISKNLE